jgi:hypothetical protein
MASVLDIITGLNQAAANAGDYGGEYEDADNKIGLKREEGDPILDSRVMDGFKVRFAADKMIVTYESEMRVEDLHPRNKFENEIEGIFGEIISFLKKEYRKIKKGSASLTPSGDANILVQSTSRNHTWVSATKQYKIGGIDDVDSVGKTSEEKLNDNIKKFMELATDKRPSNDKRPKDQGPEKDK